MLFRQRLIYEYSGIDFIHQKDLNIVEFLAISRDGFIDKMNKTEEGREYLNSCWIAEQVKPDREALKRNFSIREE